MIKKKAVIEKHYFSVFFFLFILVYSWIVPGKLGLWATDSVTQSFHAVDYSMGFCSRFLPGAIYSFFFGSVSEQKLNVYISVLMILFFFALSLLLERFIHQVEREYRFVATVLLVFFVTGPSTFSIFIKVPGMLDIYWVFAALLFFVLLSKKQTWFLLFVPFVFCILTYYVTWICYIPFFVIIILYKMSVTDTKKEKLYLWVSLIVSVAVAVALTVYFVLFEKSNLVYTLEGFMEALSSKGCDYHWYYTESLYYYGVDIPPVDNIFEELLIRISVNFSAFNSFSKISVFILVLPVTGFIYKFFLKQISVCANKMKKFSYVCMLLLFAGTIVSAIFTSTDLVRWVGHAFLPLFAGFLYVLHNEGSTAWDCVKENFEKYSFRTILIYLIFYMSVVYNPYSV